MTRPTDTAGPETDRLIGDLVRVGVIDSVDLAAGKAIVSFGAQTTPPIDWLMAVGDTTIWIPPTVGQQVAVICPEADPEQGFIVSGLPSSAMAPLFLGRKNAIRFSDGAEIRYDPDAGQLNVETPGKVTLVAPGGVLIQGDTTIDGAVEITGDVHTPGTITGDTDVVAAGKSGKGHKHTGVTAGSGVSGGPQ